MKHFLSLRLEGILVMDYLKFAKDVQSQFHLEILQCIRIKNLGVEFLKELWNDEIELS